MNAYDKTSIQINRCKRILELVDDYVEKQDTATRTALRKALMDEFEAPVIAPPVAAGSVDTEAMRKIALAATPGPWMAWGEVAHEIYPSPSGSLIARAIKAKDMDFIAAANPVAVLALIERAEKAEARVKELELDLMLKNPLVEELRCDILGFKEQVAGLEAQLAASKRYYLTS